MSAVRGAWVVYVDSAGDCHVVLKKSFPSVERRHRMIHRDAIHAEPRNMQIKVANPVFAAAFQKSVLNILTFPLPYSLMEFDDGLFLWPVVRYEMVHFADLPDAVAAYGIIVPLIESPLEDFRSILSLKDMRPFNRSIAFAIRLLQDMSRVQIPSLGSWFSQVIPFGSPCDTDPHVLWSRRCSEKHGDKTLMKRPSWFSSDNSPVENIQVYIRERISAQFLPQIEMLQINPVWEIVGTVYCKVAGIQQDVTLKIEGMHELLAQNLYIDKPESKVRTYFSFNPCVTTNTGSCGKDTITFIPPSGSFLLCMYRVYIPSWQFGVDSIVCNKSIVNQSTAAERGLEHIRLLKTPIASRSKLPFLPVQAHLLASCTESNITVELKVVVHEKMTGELDIEVILSKKILKANYYSVSVGIVDVNQQRCLWTVESVAGKTLYLKAEFVTMGSAPTEFWGQESVSRYLAKALFHFKLNDKSGTGLNVDPGNVHVPGRRTGVAKTFTILSSACYVSYSFDESV